MTKLLALTQRQLSLAMTGLLAAIATKLIVTNRLPLTPQVTGLTPTLLRRRYGRPVSL